jgi:hypothetical protein
MKITIIRSWRGSPGTASGRGTFRCRGVIFTILTWPVRAQPPVLSSSRGSRSSWNSFAIVTPSLHTINKLRRATKNVFARGRTEQKLVVGHLRCSIKFRMHRKLFLVALEDIRDLRRSAGVPYRFDASARPAHPVPCSPVHQDATRLVSAGPRIS